MKPRISARARGRRMAALAVFVLMLSMAPPAHAVWPWTPGRRPEPPIEKAPWQRTRVMVAAGLVVPVEPRDFVAYWNPAAGQGVGVAFPLTPWLDAAFVLDHHYRLGFDAERFTHDFGAPSGGDLRASVGPILIVGRVHPNKEGFRPYADLGVGLMDISRPAVFYQGPTGPAAFEGAEIFGLDPCYGAGGGIEWLRWRRPLGAFLEAHWIDAPARTRPAHVVVTTRAGLILIP